MTRALILMALGACIISACSTAIHTPERDSTARSDQAEHVSMVDAPGKSSDKGGN